MARHRKYKPGEGLTAHVLRFMTFERVLLTHTYGSWQGDFSNYFAIFNEDRTEIRGEESEDLVMLEILIVESKRPFIQLKHSLPEFLQNTRLRGWMQL
jgi:hypothetical protein